MPQACHPSVSIKCINLMLTLCHMLCLVQQKHDWCSHLSQIRHTQVNETAVHGARIKAQGIMASSATGTHWGSLWPTILERLHQCKETADRLIGNKSETMKHSYNNLRTAWGSSESCFYWTVMCSEKSTKPVKHHWWRFYLCADLTMHGKKRLRGK